MVSELHDLRMACFFKVVTPGWVMKSTPFSLKIDCTHFSDPFEISQVKVKRVFSAGPACLVPRTLGRQSEASFRLTSRIFMYFMFDK